MSRKSKNRLLLIDGHSMAYRAFFALPADSFTTATGQHTNAIYGFANMLMSLIKEEGPTHIAVAFDVSRKTFRTEKYPEYKATRSATPDEFRSQIPLLHELLQAMQIKEFSLEGYEADDLLATISKRAAEEGFEVFICTGDRDSFQLVTNEITVLYPKKGVSELARMTPTAVQEKYGMTPTQYHDFAALRGDPSDNLPSIPGVGEKTAAKWIIEYGTLNNLVAKVDEVDGKVGDSLRAHLNSVLLNHELTQLISDVPIKFHLDELNWSGYDTGALRQIFTQLEFRSLLNKLPNQPEETATVDTNFITPDELNQKLSGFTGTVGFLFELLEERLNTYAAALSSTEVYLVMSDEIGGWIADPKITKISHDYKSLARVIDVKGVVFDTALASYLVDPGNRLTEVSEILARWGLSDASMAAKASALFSLKDKLSESLTERGALKLLTDLELPVSQVLAEMERIGVAIDKSVLKAQGEDLAKEVAAQSKRAFEDRKSTRLNSSH